MYGLLSEYVELAYGPQTPEAVEKMAYIASRGHTKDAMSILLVDVAADILATNGGESARRAMEKLLQLPGAVNAGYKP